MKPKVLRKLQTMRNPIFTTLIEKPVKICRLTPSVTPSVQIAHQPGVETLSYTYDSMSRRTNETRSSTGARNFGYDPTGQLLQVTHPAGTATFSYDAVGNRLSVSGAAGAGSYSSNVLNQYTSAGGLGTLTYDANGNLAGGGGWTYSHNSNSWLISANGPGGASASFGRDARNREVKRTLNGVTTYHIYDDWNLVAEYNSTGTLTTRYIHGPRVDDHRSLGRLGGDCRRQPEGRDERERASQWIAPLGLYDYRNRTYSPTLGRFLQLAPIRFDAGDVNLYRYVANNSVNWVDPLGLITVVMPGAGPQNSGSNGNFADRVSNMHSDARQFGRHQRDQQRALDAIKDALAKDPCEEVNIYGYSRGGVGALELAEKLNQAGIPVDNLILVDPVTVTGNGGGLDVPSNARNAESHYQGDGRPWNPFRPTDFPGTSLRESGLGRRSVPYPNQHHAKMPGVF
jgi:RHS repeat-associated protein